MLRLLSEADPAPRYQPYNIIKKTRKIDSPIHLNGEKVTRYKAPCITEYVDMQTGEIIPAIALKNNPEVWPTVHNSERMLQREFILHGLRDEVREFAVFILQFRNQRRGVTPGVEQLVKWYAEITGKQACHVRRYVPPLENAGVIAGSSVLGPLFQIAGRSVSANKHLGEDSEAARKFMLIRAKYVEGSAEACEAAAQAVLEARCPVEDTYAAIIKTSKLNSLTGIEYIQADVDALLSAGILRAQFPLCAFRSAPE